MTVAELIEKLQTEMDPNAPVIVSAPAVGNVPLTDEMVQDWTTNVFIFVQ